MVYADKVVVSFDFYSALLFCLTSNLENAVELKKRAAEDFLLEMSKAVRLAMGVPPTLTTFVLGWDRGEHPVGL